MKSENSKHEFLPNRVWTEMSKMWSEDDWIFYAVMRQTVLDEMLKDIVYEDLNDEAS